MGSAGMVRGASGQAIGLCTSRNRRSRRQGRLTCSRFRHNHHSDFEIGRSSHRNPRRPRRLHALQAPRAGAQADRLRRGSPSADLMFVGEAPGADEDIQGIPFVGRAGQLLTKMIEAMGLKRDDVYIANVLKCRPPNNRDPQPDEVERCEPFLFRQIASVQPKVIVALGAFAARALLKTQDPVSRMRGRVYNYRGAKLIVTFHPSFLLRSPATSVGGPEEGIGRARARAASTFGARVGVRHIRVAVPVPALGALTYSVPDEFPQPPTGVRVLVPWHAVHDRRRSRDGADEASQKVKPIVDVLDEAAFLPEDIVSLTAWIADYYACGFGEAVAAAMPPRSWVESERYAQISDSGHAVAPRAGAAAGTARAAAGRQARQG